MKKLSTLLAAILLLTVFLTGCGNADNNTEQEQTDKTTESAGEERVMTDALGHEVKVPANPERVIASYLEDHLLALGIKPVAQWSVNDGASIQNYLQNKLDGVPLIPHDLPYEAVMSLNPDFILIGSPGTVEGGKYEQYAKIAPTFVLNNEEVNDWRQVLLKVGEVFGKEKEAKEVLAKYEEKAKEAKEKISSEVGEQSAAAVWIVNNSVFMVNENAASGVVMYSDLGLKVPSLVKEVSASATGDWSQVSLEKLAELDADHLFVINSDGASGSEMFKDPIWKNIPAVKNNNIHEFSPETSWLYNGSIAAGQIIDNVLESVLK